MVRLISRATAAVAFTVEVTTQESDRFVLDARRTPHVAYAVIADTMLRDIFAQPLTGDTVERGGFGTLAIAHVNADGRETSARRMPLVAGTHVIRASASANQSDEARVTIER